MPTRQKQKFRFYPLTMTVTIIGIVVCGFWLYARHIEKRKVMLIYRTDHIVLLEACRQVIAQRRAGQWEKEEYNIDPKMRPEVEVQKLPQAILKLKPCYVIIEENILQIEMYGGFAHFGIIAYAEDYKERGGLANKELIHGLYYYDDGYIKRKDYDEYIKSLKPK